jgi:GWxTD domain-containing protein
MLYHKLQFMLFLAFAVMMFTVPMQAADIDPKLVAKVEEARQLLEDGQADKALTLAKEIVRKNRYYGDGQECLAQAYIAKGEMSNLMRAREAIGEAVRINPKNASYYITFAELEEAQGHKQLALGRIREGVKLAPEDAIARRTLIDLLEGEIEFYHNKIQSEGSMSGNSGTPEESLPAIFDPNIRRHISKNNVAFTSSPGMLNRAFEQRHRFDSMLDRFTGDVEALVNEVRFSYIQLLNYHPDDIAARDGYFALLLRFWLWEDLDEGTLSFLKSRKPEPTVLLYHALAQYYLGNDAQAEQDFRTAFILMPEADRRPYESIEWLLQADERVEYLQMSSSERLKENQSFWNERDPLLISNLNERQIEHWCRVAEANLRFSGDAPAAAGWKSDKGLVFIKYGRPERELRISRDVRRILSQETVSYDNQGNRQRQGSVTGWAASNFSPARTIDYWLYPDYSFRFENYEGVRFSNDFTFATFDNTDFKQVLKEEEAHTPEATQVELAQEPATFPMTFATFRGKLGNTRVETYFKIPNLEEDKVADSLAQTQNLVAGVFFSSAATAQRTGSPRRMQAKQKTTIRWPSEIPPGDYALITELQHEGTKRVGRMTESINVPGYGDALLMISDVVMADYANVDTKRLNIRDGIMFNPRVGNTFAGDEPVYVYYEIYHLIPGGENMTAQYEVSYTVRLLPDETGLFGMARKLLGNDRDQSSVTTSLQYEGTETTAYNFLDIRSIGLGIGEHEFTVRVKDLISDMVTERTARFTITE